jgi:hypothetical protein
MAKKSGKSKLPQTPNGILAFWLKAAQEGLGDKRFAAQTRKRFAPKLRTAIRKRLRVGPFQAGDARNTRQLARMFGRICRIASDDKQISVDTFQKAFQLVKDHPRCPPTSAGAGEWCSIS